MFILGPKMNVIDTDLKERLVFFCRDLYLMFFCKIPEKQIHCYRNYFHWSECFLCFFFTKRRKNKVEPECCSM